MAGKGKEQGKGGGKDEEKDGERVRKGREKDWEKGTERAGTERGKGGKFARKGHWVSGNWAKGAGPRATRFSEPDSLWGRFSEPGSFRWAV